MVISQEATGARLFDADDVLIDRGWSTRAFGLALGRIRPLPLPENTVEELPDPVREVIDEPLSDIAERISFAFHRQRQVIPDVTNVLEVSRDEGIINYINTGRSNKREWVDMTWDTLERGGISDFFVDAFFTPEEVRTAVSKAAAIKELSKHYQTVEHVDDDPRTAVYLARLFPNVTIYLLHYGLTGLVYSKREVESYPNIRRLGVLQELTPDKAL